MKLSNKLENTIRNNVKFDETAPWSYVVYINKHIPHGSDVLRAKVEEIEKFAVRNQGYCKTLSEPGIAGDNLTVRIEMNCDCVAAKAFDAVVEEKTRPYIYISMNKETAVWSAVASASRADNHPIRFCAEKEYPVDLYFMRSDINGSSSLEKEVCRNRGELLKTLNYLGECGFTPWDLWDFHVESSRNEKILDVFAEALRKREEKVLAALDDMIDDAELQRNEYGDASEKAEHARSDSDRQF